MSYAQIGEKARQAFVNVLYADILHDFQMTPDANIFQTFEEEGIDTLQDRTRAELQIVGDFRLQSLTKLKKGKRPHQGYRPQNQREERE